MAKRSFGVVVGAFMGRMFKKTIYGLLGALCRALVLGYPVKWIWNELRADLSLQTVVSAVNYWTAFGIVLLIGFLFLDWFTDNKAERKEE